MVSTSFQQTLRLELGSSRKILLYLSVLHGLAVLCVIFFLHEPLWLGILLMAAIGFSFWISYKKYYRLQNGMSVCAIEITSSNRCSIRLANGDFIETTAYTANIGLWGVIMLFQIHDNRPIYTWLMDDSCSSESYSRLRARIKIHTS